ncbi:MAG TPA: hypothetical protein VFE33_33820 [Thermoanaerobaculia bacterium]|nr:hypothetical protein [Thermoanaerobaculia bacterium]
MPTLRLTQTAVGEDLHRVEIALEEEGRARETSLVELPFRFSEDDQRDLRWYLEEYLQAPEEPHPKIAARVERRMAEIGAELFGAVFRGGALRLWARLQDRLEETRVEIVTGVAEATTIPWELLRDPDSDVALALRARSFVRAQPNPVKRPTLPTPKAGTPLRILLVICRPKGRDDVPFRSVSARILKSLTEEARAWACSKPMAAGTTPSTRPCRGFSRNSSHVPPKTRVSRPGARSSRRWGNWVTTTITPTGQESARSSPPSGRKRPISSRPAAWRWKTVGGEG